MNIQTHFLDGSMIYGADETTCKGLREFQGGRLIIHNDYGRDLLPSSAKGNNCLMKGHGAACYIGGQYLFYSSDIFFLEFNLLYFFDQLRRVTF